MTQPHRDFEQPLADYRTYFPGPHLQMVVDSMLAGNTAGQLWNVARNGESPLLVLWDGGNNVFYLAGDVHDGSSLQALAELLAGQLLPRVRAHGIRRFKVRALSPPLESELPRLFPGVDLRPTVTHFSVHNAARRVAAPHLDLPDLRVIPITPALLSGDELAGVDDVRDEIREMWPSEDRFHERGFGTLAVLGSELICWCTAEYVGPTHCGTGIATAPDFQRRGVATATAAQFVREASARGLVPCWECDGANIPSVRVAEKAGFIRQAEEKYWIGWLEETFP
jgi:RimJ/RimL family protein N-acetyltransferase